MLIDDMIYPVIHVDKGRIGHGLSVDQA